MVPLCMSLIGSRRDANRGKAYKKVSVDNVELNSKW